LSLFDHRGQYPISHTQNTFKVGRLLPRCEDSKDERKTADNFAVASEVCDRAQRRLFDGLRGEQNDEEKSRNPCRHLTEKPSKFWPENRQAFPCANKRLQIGPREARRLEYEGCRRSLAHG